MYAKNTSRRLTFNFPQVSSLSIFNEGQPPKFEFLDLLDIPYWSILFRCLATGWREKQTLQQRWCTLLPRATKTKWGQQKRINKHCQWQMDRRALTLIRRFRQSCTLKRVFCVRHFSFRSVYTYIYIYFFRTRLEFIWHENERIFLF